jgi:hypothetical protein
MSSIEVRTKPWLGTWRGVGAAAIGAGFLWGLVAYHRHEVATAEHAAVTVRRACDCNRIRISIDGARLLLESTKGQDGRGGGAAGLLLAPMVAVCTGDESFAAQSFKDFAEAATPQAAAAALGAVEQRIAAAIGRFDFADCPTDEPRARSIGPR